MQWFTLVLRAPTSLLSKEEFLILFWCRLRGELNPLQEASGGKKISINDLVIKVIIFHPLMPLWCFSHVHCFSCRFIFSSCGVCEPQFLIYLYVLRRLQHWLFERSPSVTVLGWMILFASKFLVAFISSSSIVLARNVIWQIYSACRYNNVNINVAVQTEHGLFVPVVRVSWSRLVQ